MHEYLLLWEPHIGALSWEYKCEHASDEMAIDYAKAIARNIDPNRLYALQVWKMPEQKLIAQLKVKRVITVEEMELQT